MLLGLKTLTSSSVSRSFSVTFGCIRAQNAFSCRAWAPIVWQWQLIPWKQKSSTKKWKKWAKNCVRERERKTRSAHICRHDVKQHRMQCNTKSKSFKQWARAISSTQLRHGSARHTQISIFIIVCLFSKTFCWLLLLSSLSSFLFSIFFASFQLHSDFSSSFFYCVCALDSCVYCVSIRCMDAVRCTFVSDGIRRNTGHCVCQMGDNCLWSLSIPLRLGSLRARHEMNSEWTFGFWCGVIMCLQVVSIKK